MSPFQISDRKSNVKNKATHPQSTEGPQWDRLKISLLANRATTPEVPRHSVQSTALHTRYRDRVAECQNLLGNSWNNMVDLHV